MKTYFFALLVFLSISFQSVQSATQDEEARLVTAARKAFDTHDADALAALTCWDRVPDKLNESGKKQYARDAARAISNVMLTNPDPKFPDLVLERQGWHGVSIQSGGYKTTEDYIWTGRPIQRSNVSGRRKGWEAVFIGTGTCKMKMILFIVAIGIGTVSSSQAENGQDVSKSQFISGRVVDNETGQAVADFAVQTSTPNFKNPEDVFWNFFMLGDQQSSVQFSAPSPTKNEMVRIIAPGYVPQILTEQSVSNLPAGGLEIRLKRGDALRGVVRDDAEHPVAGARVLMATVQPVWLRDGKFEYGAFRSGSTTTDNAGRFSLRGEGEALQKVVIVSPDGHLVWPAVQSQPGQELRITLPKPGTLIVRYDIPGDLPEAKPELQLLTQKMEMPLWFLSFGQSITVTNGSQFVLTNLTPGAYNFRRWKSIGSQGAESEVQTVVIEAGQNKELDMVRTNGQRVHGQVIGPGPALASGGYIYVKSANATGQPWPQGSRNYEKEYNFPSFDVSQFGADGSFQTAMLKPGAYTVIANVYPPPAPPGTMPYRNDNPDYVGVAKVTVTADPMPPLTLKLAPALYVDIDGGAVDDETGEPIPDLMIQTGQINPDKPDEIIWNEGFEGTYQGINEACKFLLCNQKEGFALRFLACGYVPQAITRSEVIASRRTANLQVRMKRGGNLHGVVRDHAGRPVAGTTVYLAPLDLGYVRFGEVMSSGNVTNWAHTFAMTDAAGRFFLRGVGKNKIRIIVVTEDGRMVQPVQVTGPGQDLKITLPKPATLIVRYDIPGDVAETYFDLTLRTNKLELPLWEYIAPKTTAKVTNGGQIVLSNLTAGTYNFSRIMMGGPTNADYMFIYGDPPEDVQGDLQTLVLKPGRTREVRMVRSVGQRVQGQVTGLQGITNGQAYLYVGTVAAISSPRSFKSKLEPCFDAVKLGEDGRFETALLEPGTYALMAEVFKWGDQPDRKPIADDEPQQWAWGVFFRSRRPR